MVQGFKISRRTCGTWLKTKLIVEHYLAAKVLRQDVFIRDSDTDILEMLSWLSPIQELSCLSDIQKRFCRGRKDKTRPASFSHFETFAADSDISTALQVQEVVLGGVFLLLFLRICAVPESSWTCKCFLFCDTRVVLQWGWSGSSGIHHWLPGYGAGSSIWYAARPRKYVQSKACSLSLSVF